MTTIFECPITQYDKSFDQLFTNTNAKKGFSCSYFAILTAHKFMKDGDTSAESHLSNVTLAVKVSKELETNGGILIDNLISDFTTLKSNDIFSATTELIATKVIQYSDIFPALTETMQRYSVIILKNEKYISVLVDKDGYYLRDCHERTQYNFKEFINLIEYLENAYQFATTIDIGVDYSAYSSIEFIIVTTEFETLLTGLIDNEIEQKPTIDPFSAEFKGTDMAYLEMLDDYYNSNEQDVKYIDFDKVGSDEEPDFVDF